MTLRQYCSRTPETSEHREVKIQKRGHHRDTNRHHSRDAHVPQDTKQDIEKNTEAIAITHPPRGSRGVQHQTLENAQHSCTHRKETNSSRKNKPAHAKHLPALWKCKRQTTCPTKSSTDPIVHQYPGARPTKDTTSKEATLVFTRPPCLLETSSRHQNVANSACYLACES